MMKKEKFDLQKGVPLDIIDYDIRYMMYHLKKSNQGQKLFNADAYKEDLGKAIRQEIRNIDDAEAILKSELYSKITDVFEVFTDQMYQLFLIKQYLHQLNKSTIKEEDITAALEYGMTEEINQIKAGQFALDPTEVVTFYLEEETIPQNEFGEKLQNRSKSRRGPAGGYL